MYLCYDFQIGWHSVMRMSADLRDLFLYEAFLYYNPLLLVVSIVYYVSWSLYELNFPSLLSMYNLCGLFLQTLMVWLWGINLWVFSQANVNYSEIFDIDQTHLTHKEIWKVMRTFMLSIFSMHFYNYFY